MNDISIVRAKQLNANGWLNGFIGVLLFSGSLPATKLAILGFSPLFLTFARATIAGLLALAALTIFKQKRPKRNQILPLIIVALGVVLGYPLLSALALQHITSAHSIVFVGLLPLATALFGVWRGGERPRPLFWLFSIAGSLLVISYAVAQGLTASPVGDLLMLAAIIVCGLGYAEGARLSKTLGGWQVISWALLTHCLLCCLCLLFICLLVLKTSMRAHGSALPMCLYSACSLALYSGIKGWRRAAWHQ
ncbi:DMT family transporter [Niabella defluvii]|nr:DMT family transporter [Niabella sp. I65]